MSEGFLRDRDESSTLTSETAKKLHSQVEGVTTLDASSEKTLQSVIFFAGEQSEDVNKVKEQAIYKLGRLYGSSGRTTELIKLSKDVRPFFDSISKAKTAKIVRSLIDILAETKSTGGKGLEKNFLDTQVQLCEESIQWARDTKRNFLRQRIETRLAALYIEAQKYQLAGDLITNLVREVKRLDDKLLLVEIQLLESRLHHALKNIAKAKASLTAARTSANAIYCPPILQTQLDHQSGILHAEENDYKTAYSYFFESFEGFNSLDDARAVISLKYMLLSKIMVGSPDDVQSIISGKMALKYAGVDIEAMKAVAKAHSNRSLQEFEVAKTNFRAGEMKQNERRLKEAELTNDPIIDKHLTDLYDTLLEQNLVRILEPFSVVEIAHVAQVIQLPLSIVERKLSQMILDKQFSGILDQGLGQLIIYEESQEDMTYTNALGTISNMSKVVDSLYEKTNKLYVA
ncbi:hypothetical protein PROFUN_14380 [Planoprotostelium fungivorum]|uniref:PCI domain-containing protein n=1 Tax=Planoprotostelium fungivorum TaxID=1890364 RepID=A0A2P6MVX0_9EUKA|nr:hypothetical protein PROFUN_14380 [Planoprotostelium fungivorum]